MTRSKAEEVCAKLREVVREDYHFVQPYRSASLSLPMYQWGEDDRIAHLLFMLDEIPKMENVDKAMRWLGFVQGVVWACGWRTIDDMKDWNRQSEDSDETAAASSGRTVRAVDGAE